MRRLEELTVRPGWRDRAACAEHDPDVFHPATVGIAQRNAIAAAKEVCDGCPVREDCLGWVLGLRENPSGIFGGLTHDERKRLRRGMTRRLDCERCGEPVGDVPLSGNLRRFCDRCRLDTQARANKRSKEDRARPFMPCVVCRTPVPDERVGQSRTEPTCGRWECKRALRLRRSNAAVWGDDDTLDGMGDDEAVPA